MQNVREINRDSFLLGINDRIYNLTSPNSWPSVYYGTWNIAEKIIQRIKIGIA